MTAADTLSDLSKWKPRGKRITQAEKAYLASAGVRWCPTCRSVKPLEAFGVNRAAPDGLLHRCKPCVSAKDRQRYAANPEKVAEANRRWREANPDKVAEKDRRWRAANREKIAEKDRRYREANREKVAEKNRRWQAANLDKVAEANRRWREANPAKVRQYYATNREVFAARSKARHADTVKTARRIKAAAVYFRERPAFLQTLAAYTLRHPRSSKLMFASHTVEALCAWHVGDITLPELQEGLCS